MASSDENDEMMECEENEDMEEEDIGEGGGVDFHPPEDESATVDESAYIMYHEANAGAPCLSFDVIPDLLGERREDFPMTCYTVAGTQAARGNRNYVVVMKMSNLLKTTTKTENEDNEDDEDDEESDEDDETEEPEGQKPKMEMAAISHAGGVNRIRCTVMQEDSYLAATWSDTGKVNIFNLQPALAAVNNADTMKEYDYEKRQDSSPPLFSRDLGTEGFALDWNRLTPGTLVVGNCAKHLEVFAHSGGGWQSQGQYSGHTASVEDIQWSPTENNVFASCGVDQTIRIWDSRVSGKKGCRITVKEAHANDVNVVHWNHVETHFLISGGDDNNIKVWDLRQITKGTPIGTFSFHKGAITSVEWNPNDGAVFAASGEDDVVTLWDLSLEKDDQAGSSDAELEVPQQLLFTHHGQHEVKEVHWHPQLPGVLISTAHSGINIFKTIST